MLRRKLIFDTNLPVSEEGTEGLTETTMQCVLLRLIVSYYQVREGDGESERESERPLPPPSSLPASGGTEHLVTE